MKLSKKQLELLINISHQTGNKSMNRVGKKIYNTYISIHKNMNILSDSGLIILRRYKNKLVPTITERGKEYIKDNF